MATKAEVYQSQQRQKRQFKTTPHQFTKKVFHWPYCSGCGLVLLKNESSQKRSKEPCQSMEDQMYTDTEMYDWLESNEHSLNGDLYNGYELITTYKTYTGKSIRDLMSNVLDDNRLYM